MRAATQGSHARRNRNLPPFVATGGGSLRARASGFSNPGRLMVKHLISDEEKCEACNGTGFPVVKQPGEPGRKIYPEPCKKCGGKGRVRKATWGK